MWFSSRSRSSESSDSSEKAARCRCSSLPIVFLDCEHPDFPGYIRSKMPLCFPYERHLHELGAWYEPLDPIHHVTGTVAFFVQFGAGCESSAYGQGKESNDLRPSQRRRQGDYRRRTRLGGKQ